MNLFNHIRDLFKRYINEVLYVNKNGKILKHNCKVSSEAVNFMIEIIMKLYCAIDKQDGDIFSVITSEMKIYPELAKNIEKNESICLEYLNEKERNDPKRKISYIMLNNHGQYFKTITHIDFKVHACFANNTTHISPLNILTAIRFNIMTETILFGIVKKKIKEIIPNDYKKNITFSKQMIEETLMEDSQLYRIIMDERISQNLPKGVLMKQLHKEKKFYVEDCENNEQQNPYILNDLCSNLEFIEV